MIDAAAVVGMLDTAPERSVAPESEAEQLNLHRSLARFNAMRLRPGRPCPQWREELADATRMQVLEHEFLERERRLVAAEVARVPTDGSRFISWFAALRDYGPGQGDALFPWLAEQAGWAEMRWFLCQEAAGEAGFDDLLAITQVRLPARAKLEVARNFWDEAGRGREAGMHAGLLSRLIRHFDLRPAIEGTTWQSLALGNLMVAMAADRHYAYHSLGALGVIELTAPTRVALVDVGLRRLGVPARERAYFEIHAALDVKHATAWMDEVIQPLVERDPATAACIAEGALMRLRAGARCFACYRERLGIVCAPGRMTMDVSRVGRA